MDPLALTVVGLFYNFHGWELLVILGLALLLFGKRLPELGKSLGQSIVEFKKGIKGAEDDSKESGR